MARLPSSAGRGRRTHSLIYIFAAVAIVVVVVAFVYGPESSNGTGSEEGNPLDRNLNIPAANSIANAGTLSTQEGSEPEASEPEPAVIEPIGEPEPVVVREPTPEPNTADTAIPAAVDGAANTKVSALILEAADLSNANRVVEARDILNGALAMPMTPQQRAYIRNQLSKLAQEWLMTRSVFPGDKLCSSYKVQPGEYLTTIAARYKIPYELIMEINNISRPENLKAGQTLKVVNGPFHVKIYRSSYTMDVYLQNTLVRTYIVGLGKPGRETPTGLWVVKNRMIKPRWTDPDTGHVYEPTDPDYPLGSRWIGLEGKKGDALGRDGFAIHGTNKPEEIGTNSSRGCIRLHNGNAVAVYNMLKEGLSQVEVMN